MIEYIKSVLDSYDWEIDIGIVSIVLFGEYPFPKKDDYKHDNI